MTDIIWFVNFVKDQPVIATFLIICESALIVGALVKFLEDDEKITEIRKEFAFKVEKVKAAYEAKWQARTDMRKFHQERREGIRG